MSWYWTFAHIDHSIWHLSILRGISMWWLLLLFVQYVIYPRSEPFFSSSSSFSLRLARTIISVRKCRVSNYVSTDRLVFDTYLLFLLSLSFPIVSLSYWWSRCKMKKYTSCIAEVCMCSILFVFSLSRSCSVSIDRIIMSCCLTCDPKF